MAAQIKIYQDGPYLVNGGQETQLDGCALVVRADGGVTLRFDPANVELVDTPVNANIYDFGGLTTLLARAVHTSGLAIAEINDVNSDKAAAVSTYMLGHLWLPGTVE